MKILGRVHVLVGLLCLLITPGSLDAASKLPAEAMQLMDAPRYKHSHWGILVTDLQTGQAIYELNADKLFAPASTTKLFSMAAGLDALGAGYQFKIPISRTGPVREGELDGDLVLVASGDLTMGGRTDATGHIAYTQMDHTDAGMDGPLAAILTEQDPLAGINSLAKQVAASGITRVRGEVIVDDRLFETSRAGYGFLRTPITVNDNLIDFVITPTEPGKAAQVDWRPHTAAYQLEAQVVTVASTEVSQILLTAPGPGRILVKGRMPATQKPSIRVWHVEDPASFARTLLIEALQRAGVKMDASPVGKNPSARLPPQGAVASLPQVALLTSPPYAETVKLILKVSHNLGADITPLLIAARHGRRSFEEGMALIGAFLKRAGVDIESISLADGQGGERSNQVTPLSVVQLLRYMATRPDFEAYYNAQPILGVDGSLAHTVKPGSPARGKVHAKTGTIVTGDLLNDRGILLVKGLAGYMTSSRGRKLAFAFYVNNMPMNDLNDIITVGNDLGRLAEIVFLNQ